MLSRQSVWDFRQNIFLGIFFLDPLFHFQTVWPDWRKFCHFGKILTVLANFGLFLVWYLSNFCTCFGNFIVLGKFSMMQTSKDWKIIQPFGHTASKHLFFSATYLHLYPFHSLSIIIVIFLFICITKYPSIFLSHSFNHFLCQSMSPSPLCMSLFIHISIYSSYTPSIFLSHSFYHFLCQYISLSPVSLFPHNYLFLLYSIYYILSLFLSI